MTEAAKTPRRSNRVAHMFGSARTVRCNTPTAFSFSRYQRLQKEGHNVTISFSANMIFDSCFDTLTVRQICRHLLRFATSCDTSAKESRTTYKRANTFWANELFGGRLVVRLRHHVVSVITLSPGRCFDSSSLRVSVSVVTPFLS